MLEKILWYLEVARNPRWVLAQSYYDESIIHQTLRSFSVVIKAKIRGITDMHKEAWEENVYFIFQTLEEKNDPTCDYDIHDFNPSGIISTWLYVRCKSFTIKWLVDSKYWIM